jgi:hypothetical protein
MTARRPRIVVANIAQSGMDDWSLRKWDCDEPAASPSEPPDHTLVEICRRVRTPSLAVVVCGIYQDSARGVVLRATFEHSEIVRVCDERLTQKRLVWPRPNGSMPFT